MVVYVKINGTLAKALIDPGCTSPIIVSPEFQAKANLKSTSKTFKNVVLGDNVTSIKAPCVTNLQLQMKNHCMLVSGCIMNIGYDIILGKPFTDSLEARSANGTWYFSTLNKQISCTINGKYVCLNQCVSTEMIATARHNRHYLQNMSSYFNDKNLEDGKMVLLDIQHHGVNVIPTKMGDDYQPVGKKVPVGSSFPPQSHSEKSVLAALDCPGEDKYAKPDSINEESELKARLKIIPSQDDHLQQYASLEPIKHSEKSGIKKDFHSEDEHFAGTWVPADCQKSAKTRDNEVFNRCENGANTPEVLRDKFPEIESLVKEFGVCFNDAPDVHETPTRDGYDVKFEHHDKDVRPLCEKVYKLSPAESKAVAEIIQDMLKKGVIRPSDSPWGTPVFVVPKASGGYRLCADYRVLNKMVIQQSYALPATDQLLDQMREAKYFTLSDLTWGYHQLRYEKDSIPATAIRTPFGTFEFTVLNFGPSIAPPAWQRFIEAVMRPFLGKFVLIFLDDLIIFSKSYEEHLEHLKLVWKRLIANRLFLRLSKCKFCRTVVQYLGWVIGDGKLAPSQEKVKAVSEWPVPTSKQEVRSFIGFCNFYRRLIKNCSGRMAPLSDLVKDSVPEKDGFTDYWKEEAQTAFEDMKQALTSEPVVILASDDKPYLLECDASNAAVGAVLYQQREDTGQWHVVGYMSKRLGGAQSRYDPSKLELLALIVSLRHWRHYLQGCKCLTIITDNEPLISLRTTKNPSRMLQRWLHFIESFQFTIKHRPGKQNIGSDFLSRRKEVENEPSLQVTDDDDLPDGDPPDITLAQMEDITGLNEEMNFANILIESGSWTDELSRFSFKESYKDETRLMTIDSHLDSLEEEIQKTLDEIKKKNQESNLWKVAKNPEVKHIIEKNGLIFFIKKGRQVLYIPEMEELREKIMYHSHFVPTAGHLGYHKTLAQVARCYWWPGAANDVRQYVRKCGICLRCKRVNIAPSLVSHKIPDSSWEIIAMDETSVSPSGGFDCIWIFVDTLTKMAHFVPAKKEGLTSLELANLFFKHVYRLHGLPMKIISDRDPRINNDFWKQLFKKAGTQLNISTAERPQTDGQSEVTVRTCIDLLRAFTNSNQDDWIEFIDAVEFAYNNSVSAATGFTPFEMNFGKHPHSLNDLWFDRALRSDSPNALTAHNIWRKTLEIMEAAKKNLRKAQIAMSKADSSRPRTETFERGDKVLIHKSAAGMSIAKNKLARNFVGPFTVLRPVGASAFLLALPPGMQIHPVINIRKLKRYDADTVEDDREGPPLPIMGRIQDKDITVEKIHCEISEDIHELFIKIPSGKISMNEAIVRGHYKECATALRTSFSKLKLPTILGRFIKKNFKRILFEGIITAWDPQHPDKMYQISYQDTDSEWINEEAGKTGLMAKPRVPKKTGRLHLMNIRDLHYKIGIFGDCVKGQEIMRIAQTGAKANSEFDITEIPENLLKVPEESEEDKSIPEFDCVLMILTRHVSIETVRLLVKIVKRLQEQRKPWLIIADDTHYGLLKQWNAFKITHVEIETADLTVWGSCGHSRSIAAAISIQEIWNQLLLNSVRAQKKERLTQLYITNYAR